MKTTRFSRAFRTAAALLAMCSLALSSFALTPRAAEAAACASGTLVKGVSTSGVYYCGADGKRWVFPNEKTYRTWYPNWNGVVTLSDAVLGGIPIGGNVTYRPGARLVKITTAPNVYAVDAGGTLRWVTSEYAARALYGANWAKLVDDVPDAFFTNYRMGANINGVADFSPSAATAAASSVNADLGLSSSGSTGAASASLSFSPASLALGSSTVATMTGYDPAGLTSLNLYVNGALAQSCDNSLNASPTSTCAVRIWGSNYASGSVVSVYGQVVGRGGRVTTSTTSFLTVGGGTATGTASTTLRFSPDIGALSAGDAMTVAIDSYDPNGIAASSIIVNGSVAKTCGQSSYPTSAFCSVSLSGNSYANGTTLTIYGQTVGRNGVTTNSATRTVTVVGAATGTASVALTLSPYATTLSWGQTTGALASAYSPNGVSQVSIYVNGTRVKLCNEASFPVSALCSYDIAAWTHGTGSLTVNAEATDRYGTVIRSETRTLNATSASSAVTLSLSPYSTIATWQDTVALATASHSSGVSSVKLYVNGALAATCAQSGLPTTAACATAIRGSNYANGTNVTVYATATTGTGATLVSPTQVVEVRN